jgi:hypothetical protein
VCVRERGVPLGKHSAFITSRMRKEL